nr:hypothetical protein CFP56_78367 [Quercus suber]
MNHDGFQQVDLVLELISEVVGTLDRIVVLLLRLIRDLHQIISMTHDGFQQVVSVLELISKAVGTLVSIVVLLQRLIPDLRQIISMAHDGFQQVVSVLELIDVVGSLVNFVVLLLLLIRICRRIWSIWTARQPAIVAIDHQNEVPLADAANGQNNVIVNEE